MSPHLPCSYICSFHIPSGLPRPQEASPPRTSGEASLVAAACSTLRTHSGGSGRALRAACGAEPTPRGWRRLRRALGAVMQLLHLVRPRFGNAKIDAWSEGTAGGVSPCKTHLAAVPGMELGEFS